VLALILGLLFGSKVSVQKSGKPLVKKFHVKSIANVNLTRRMSHGLSDMMARDDGRFGSILC